MSAMASLAECRLLRTQATDTGQTAIGLGAAGQVRAQFRSFVGFPFDPVSGRSFSHDVGILGWCDRQFLGQFNQAAEDRAPLRSGLPEKSPRCEHQ